MLTGLEAQSAVRGLSSVGLTTAIVVSAAACAVIVGVRFAWLFTSPYLIRPLDRRESQRARRLSGRPRAVMAGAGFRGAVSMAAALSVPATVASGQPFPDRDLIIFVTAVVIACTTRARSTTRCSAACRASWTRRRSTRPGAGACDRATTFPLVQPFRGPAPFHLRHKEAAK